VHRYDELYNIRGNRCVGMIAFRYDGKLSWLADEQAGDGRAAQTSEMVIVISPRRAGSVVANSSTSTTCSFGTSFTKWPWYVSVRAVVFPVPVDASYVREIRSEPPSRSSNACTWLVMPVGTFHVA
jgi:hypothetical protein